MKKISLKIKLTLKYTGCIFVATGIALFLATMINGIRCADSKSDGEGGTSNRFHCISCNWILSGKRGSETDCRYGRVSGGNL